MWAGSTTGKRVAVLFLLLALVWVPLGFVLYASQPAADSGDRPSGPIAAASASDTVVFAALGDFDPNSPNFPTMLAEAKRANTRGAEFFLALGDLGYTSNEQAWCNVIKSGVNITLVVAGNHDTTQSGPGDINQFVIYCPFNLDTPLITGPTHGYGLTYYFDYPAVNPLVRVLMVSPGIVSTQTSGENYNPGGAEYNWVIDAVNTAHAAGIPWVVAGMHKLCINAGSYGCEIGQSFWDDALVSTGVDVLLTGHYHVYERSYQVNHNSTACTSVHDGSYNAACVANFNSTTMTKGAGIVQVTNGAGGNGLYAHDGSGDGQYFPVWMMSNGNTEPGTSNGYGPLIVSLNATSLQGSTAICPAGSTDSSGECASVAPTTFQDSFRISSTGPPPPPAVSADFTFTPTNPEVGQSVAFAGTGSGGTSPYSFAWDFGDGSSDAGANVSHAYAQPGSFAVVLTVTDAGSQTAAATHTVTVTAPPPPGSPTASFDFTPTWPIVDATVNFDASASSDPGGRPLEFRWDWTNDGTFETSWSTNPSMTHVYVAAGTVHARLQVRNDLGLTDNATLTLPIDGAAPVTTASVSGTVGGHGWYRSTATVTLAATDDISGVASTWARLDGGSWGEATSATFTSEGNHTLDYYSMDRAGQRESTHTLPVHIDATAPTTVALVSGTREANGSYRVSANVTLTASDVISGMDSTRYQVDGGSWRTYATTVMVTGPGAHRVAFNSTDVAGNRETSKSVSFTIVGSPIQPPVTTLTLVGEMGSNSWYTSMVNVTLSANGGFPPVTITFRLDSGSWQTYNGTFSVADGDHVLEYYATDAADNAGLARSNSIRIDTTPPRTSVALTGTPGQNHWYVSNVTLTLTANDATSGAASTEFRLDAGSWQAYSRPIGIPNGRHVVDYRSTDVAGVTEPIVTTTIQIDRSPPHVAVSPLGGIATTATVVLSWDASDDISGIIESTVSVDGAPYAAVGQESVATLTLADGDHVIGVSAIDAAGNRAWANQTLRVDTNIFSPAGPLQGMPTYILIAMVAGGVLFLALVRRRKAERRRREQALVRMRMRAR